MILGRRKKLKHEFPQIHQELATVPFQTHRQHQIETYRRVKPHIQEYLPKKTKQRVSNQPMQPLPPQAQAKLDGIYSFLRHDRPGLIRFYRDNRHLYFFEGSSASGDRANHKIELYRLMVNGTPEKKPYFDARVKVQKPNVTVLLMSNRFLPGLHHPLPEGTRIPSRFNWHKGRGILPAFIDYLKTAGYNEVVFDDVRSLVPFEELQKKNGISFEYEPNYETRHPWGIAVTRNYPRVKIKLK